MKTAIAIIKHTFSLIFNHIGVALRITIPWFLIMVGVVLGGAFFLSSGTALTVTNETATNPVLFWVLFPVIFIVMLYAFFSCAIGWHRYILLDEAPSSIFAMPPKGLVWPYAKKSLIIALYTLLVAFVCFGLLFLAVFILPMLGVFGLVLPFVMLFFIQYLIMRMGIALPASALGEEEFTVKAAWELTKNDTSTIFFTSFFSTLLFMAISLIIQYFTASNVLMEAAYDPFSLDPSLVDPDMINQTPSAFGYVVQAIFNWFYFIFGFGVLTTLYGVIVQKREI